MPVVYCKPECKVVERSTLENPNLYLEPEFRVGEISFFNPPVVASILDNLKIGLSLKDCAALVDVRYEEVKRWNDQNRSNFGNMVEKAQAEHKKMLLLKIMRGKGDWKPASFILERRHRDEFGKDAKTEVQLATEQVMIIGGKEIRFS